MTYEQFHNALRILTSIDMEELVAAGVIAPDDARTWAAFRANPIQWFIRASEFQSRLVWTIVEARQA